MRIGIVYPDLGQMANNEHLETLRLGVQHWNAWRESRAKMKPFEREADLTDADLTGVDLSDANLTAVNFCHSNLKGAVLRRACLLRADMFNADLSGADLAGANLETASLVDANIDGANLRGSSVFGVSAWNVRGVPSDQSHLVINRAGEPHIEVDDLEVAQFIYLLLNRRKLQNVITTLGQKAVLILGRFAERKELLEAIAAKLRSFGYLPIIFDFERPVDRDLTETVRILAALSLFVIADITSPSAVPLELASTIPDYAVPFVTILQHGQPAFSMFDDLPRKYQWALPLLEYKTTDTLLANFDSKILQPALEKSEEVRRLKASVPLRRYAED